MMQEGYPFMWVWFVLPVQEIAVLVNFRTLSQEWLILEHCHKNSCCVHIGPADTSQVSSLYAAYGDSSRCDYDRNVLQKS